MFGCRKLFLYFNLSSKLVFYLVLQELLFVNHLQRNDVLALLFPSKIDIAEFALPQLPSDLKVLDFPVRLALLRLSFARQEILHHGVDRCCLYVGGCV